MSTSSTPDKGSFQAGGSPSGDGKTANDAGQGEFSMPIVPKGSATAKQSGAKAPGAGTPAQAGEKTVFEGGSGDENEGAADDGDGKTPASSDQNKENKSQRKGQEGWQAVVESMTKLNERLDKIESGKAPAAAEGDKEGDKSKDKGENEALTKVLDAINTTSTRLDRMDFEGENPDLKTAELLPEWKKVNSDPKFKDFSMQERADYVRGKAGKSAGSAMKDQLSRAEGSMPRGAGGSGKSASGGNANVTEEDVAVGRAFGFSREDLEKELS